MAELITLNINGEQHALEIDPETPLLYVLRDTLGLKSPKYGCGQEQCGTCKVLIDGNDVPSCQLPVHRVQNLEIITTEGLGTPDELHPLQETFLEEQVGQCGFCLSGMLITAQGLLNRTRYPSDDDIREAYANTLCRCGVYDRVRRAIKLRIGRLEDPIYEVQQQKPLIIDGAPDLPRSIQNHPQLDSWIRINDDETVTIFSGKAELGQGIKTALMQIAAEELDVSPERIEVKTADTHNSPNEGITAGSMSVEMSGNALRYAGAEARYLMLQMAFEELEAQTPAIELQVEDGTITDPATGRQTSYWQLMGGRHFGHEITRPNRIKFHSEHKLVGQPVKRIDLLSKITGGVSYVHDLTLPEMLHARVVRPPGYHAQLISVDTQAVQALPGVVEVVQNGNFLVVIAEGEAQAMQAMEMLQASAKWEYTAKIPAETTIYEHMLSQEKESYLIVDGTPVEDPVTAVKPPETAANTLSATYLRPYHMHGSPGPSAALALWEDEKLTVWSHTQGVFNLQAAIADVLSLETDAVRVIHTEGAGCYGHNGADDVGLDAALAALAVPGRPVSLKWRRADEHGWEPYSSAMVLKMNASLDKDGNLLDWNHDVWSYTHSTRPGGGAKLLAAQHLADPLPLPPDEFRPGTEFGGHRNASAIYDFPQKRVVRHYLKNSPLRVSALRSLGAYANIFAIESFIDELAHAAGRDPLDFRLAYLDDNRGRAVLQVAAQSANWSSRSREADRGMGLAFARYKNRQTYAAIIVEVTVNRDTGKIKLERATIAADAGQVVNPDGLSNQLEGGFVQAASWTLFEQVTYDENQVTSLNWETYPILTFADAPKIKTIILNRPDSPFMGAGEATQAPTSAAIANAVFDATGVRLREIPFTPERVRRELAKH